KAANLITSGESKWMAAFTKQAIPARLITIRNAFTFARSVPVVGVIRRPPSEIARPLPSSTPSTEYLVSDISIEIESGAWDRSAHENRGLETNCPRLKAIYGQV